jgi:hypothetical protein
MRRQAGGLVAPAGQSWIRRQRTSNDLMADSSSIHATDVEGICSAMRERMFTPGMASKGSRMLGLLRIS